MILLPELKEEGRGRSIIIKRCRSEGKTEVNIGYLLTASVLIYSHFHISVFIFLFFLNPVATLFIESEVSVVNSVISLLGPLY